MNKKIYGFDKFFEKGLTLTDLNASAANGKRGDTLVRKLKNKEKIRLTNGEEVDIELMKDPDIDGPWVPANVATDNMLDDSGKFDIVKATNYLKNTKRSKLARVNSYVDMFVDTDTPGGTYSLSDFQKDKDFGSTGAGVRIREHESIQAMFLAMRLNNRKDFPGPVVTVTGTSSQYDYPDIAKILKKMIGKGTTFGRINVVPGPGFKLTEEIVKDYSADRSWLSTFCNVPNLLASKRDSKNNLIFGSSRAYTIFHVANTEEKSTPNVIFKKFKAISKGETFKSFPEYTKSFNRKSGAEVEFSKYCPADIYVVDTNSISEVNDAIESCNDIMELSKYINDCFTARKIIPISLKRVGPSPNSPVIILNAEEGMELPKFDVTNFRLSKDMEKGIGSKIMTDSEWVHNGKTINRERNLTLDSPNTRIKNNIDGEIDGKWARHGKISLAWMKKFIEASPLYYKVNSEIKDEPIMTATQLEDLNIDDLKELLKEIESDISRLKSQIDIEINYDLAGRDITGNVEKKLISKIQSLQVIRALAIIDKHDKEKKEEVDNIVSKMLLYALSIQSQGFTSPKYIRVI